MQQKSRFLAFNQMHDDDDLQADLSGAILNKLVIGYLQPIVIFTSNFMYVKKTKPYNLAKARLHHPLPILIISHCSRISAGLAVVTDYVRATNE